MQFETFSYRHAEEILNSHLAIKREITCVLEEVEEANVAAGADGLTPKICSAFTSRKWQKEVLVMENQPHEQRFDLLKDRVAIEIEFSRYEFLSRDYIRFLSAYNADKIDVGVLITHSMSGLSRVKGKSIAPSMRRVQADLAWLRGTITVPIWVIGLK
ncbi:MAG TPA: BglII/BstYI family type II restriction endonuclease [Verrucomicrobiae bacterium]|nr:BglII/BstYI family type II restriction endonuclease [Verrucomicrobiae bacterium]